MNIYSVFSAFTSIPESFSSTGNFYVKEVNIFYKKNDSLFGQGEDPLLLRSQSVMYNDFKAD